MSIFEDRKSLKQFYIGHFAIAKKMEVANQVGQLWAFVREIQKADLVALPLKSKPAIAIGRIESNYEYNVVDPELKHIRQVTWLKTIPRSELT